MVRAEQEQDVDIIRLTPPRKPDEELDVEQVPGRLLSLKSTSLRS
jgi:hypothetical protein